MFDTPALGLVEEDYSTKLLNKHSHRTFTLEPDPCDVDQLLQSQHSLLCAETRLSQRRCSGCDAAPAFFPSHLHQSLLQWKSRNVGILVQLSCTSLDFPHRCVTQSAGVPAHLHSTINHYNVYNSLQMLLKHFFIHHSSLKELKCLSLIIFSHLQYYTLN